MLKYIVIIILTLSFCGILSAQEVTAVHDIQKGAAPNEYIIKTSIKGLVGVDIARIKYFINNDHTYKASPNNALFSDRNESYIKFYVMAVPPSGIINVEFGLILGETGENIFSVEFQYSKNEEKQTVNLPKIDLSGGTDLVAEETPKPTPPVIEEEPIIEETPEPTPVVEEEVIVDAPEPTPVVEEEVIVETPEPTPVVEEEVIVETPEPTPVVEEEVIVDTPEPTPNETSRTTTKYTVQLLSLLEFSQSRLKIYCRQHNLSITKVKKTQVGEWMKITYGEANSIQEANQIKDRLASDNGINESFVTKVK